MKQNKKNEELQSRREFFKKAAKSALPILGAIALANAPLLTKAAEESPMGCNLVCSSGCIDSCAGGCKASCQGSCTGMCINTCYTGCSSSCHNTCSGGCARSAYA